jgi:hypothetical protein
MLQHRAMQYLRHHRPGHNLIFLLMLVSPQFQFLG